MAFIDKISGVSYSSIAKVGTTLKANIQKVSGVDTPPTCTTYTWGFGDTGQAACGNRTRTTHYHDESIDKLYTDSCGGTEAADGYYSDGSGYYSYSAAGGLDTVGRSCGR